MTDHTDRDLGRSWRTDIARIWRRIYGGSRCDSLAFEFAAEIEARALEQQTAQIAEKEHQLRAARIIIAGLEERALHQSREFALLKGHSSDIAGEREANALLTSEVEALRADAERWHYFLSTRPLNTREVICAAIDAARAAMQPEVPT